LSMSTYQRSSATFPAERAPVRKRCGPGWALVLFSCCCAAEARAHPPADDYLNLQPPGPRLTLIPFIGPGFRAVYDHRFEIEKDIGEPRPQPAGRVAVPFWGASASVAARFFLMSFGASVGSHDEWRLLAFERDPETGRDRAGQPPAPAAARSGSVPPDQDPTT